MFYFIKAMGIFLYIICCIYIGLVTMIWGVLLFRGIASIIVDYIYKNKKVFLTALYIICSTYITYMASMGILASEYLYQKSIVGIVTVFILYKKSVLLVKALQHEEEDESEYEKCLSPPAF